MRATLASCGAAVWQLGPALLPAILEQDARRRALKAAATPAAAAATAADVSDGSKSQLSVLEVLTLLAQTINTAVVAFAYGVAKGDEAAKSRLLADLAAVWLQHTAQCASLLEAGLRSVPNVQYTLCVAACAAGAVEAAARHSHSAGRRGATAAGSQQQVFALLLSCLKEAPVAADKGTSGSSSSDSAAARTEAGSTAPDETGQSTGNLVQGIIDACSWEFFPSSSSDDTGSDTSKEPGMAAGSSAQLGCVLLARCLVAAGRLLQQQAQASAGESPSRQRIMQQESSLLTACEHAVTLLVQQLPRQAAASEPRVLDEHAPLSQQLESLQSQTAAATGKAGNPASEPLLPAAALAAVAEQLQAFGAAACAALPVQQCCNHHDCSNLQQASELELVGGKSSVCGGCRVARYCSRERQVAHYKGWHKAVCKRLQAQQQQQAAQPLAAQQQQQLE